MTCACKCCCGCCCDGATGSQSLEAPCTSPKVFHGKGTICDVCCDLGEIREDIDSEEDCPGTWVTNGRCKASVCDPPPCTVCIDARARYTVGGVLQGGRSVEVTILNAADNSEVSRKTITTKTNDSYTDIGCFALSGSSYIVRFQMQGSMACSGANDTNPVQGTFTAPACGARVQRGALWFCP